MSLVPASAPITNGTTFYNKYRLIHPIGRGAFGEVWLAQDQAINHEYAVKILNPGVTIDERLKEAQIGHAFTHNNLVKVHQADVATDGKVIIAMDYLRDGSVVTLANPRNFIPFPIATKVILDVLQALEHLHSSNFFHNDIKPQNILRGAQGQAKLSDYGIVGVSPTGAPVAPQSWYILHAAPETVSGNGIECRTDIFQTGLTYYRMLVGLGVLEAKFNGLGHQIYCDALASGKLITSKDFPVFIPAAVRRIVLKAIDPDPSQRYQSALEMRRQLEKISSIGFWTCSPTGELIGFDSKYEYHFEFSKVGNNNASLNCFKRSTSSGREVRISKFSCSNVTCSDATKQQDLFLKAVIDGSV